MMQPQEVTIETSVENHVTVNWVALLQVLG